jgi:endogenous inhibitor of DNA gyrase (YacG/DUF329 family)
MIIKIVSSNGGKKAYCKCDRCGKEFTRSNSQVNQKSQYCSCECSGSGRPEVIPNACVICHKPKDNTFYDKSETRPICSKACYSVWWDKWYKTNITWERKGLPRNTSNNVSITNNVFYKQGRLNLADYNLGVW